MYRVTVDGGAQIMRPNSNLRIVADRIREQPDGRRYVRDTMAPHVVACVDMQLRRFVVSLHGYVVHDETTWPSWAHELRSLLRLPTAEPTHPTEENP